MRYLWIFIGATAIAGCVSHPARLRAGGAAPVLAHQSGVYITPADFEAGRLADAIACESESQPVRPDAFSGTTVVAMPGRSRETRYAKADIFGFRACDGTEVRFVRGASFRLVRAPPLYLYEHAYRVPTGKGGSRLIVDYAFSTTAADSVRSLTLDAMKRAYPENHRFHDLLDLAFRRDDELIQYDDFHHAYRVARLRRQTSEPRP